MEGMDTGMWIEERKEGMDGRTNGMAGHLAVTSTGNSDVNILQLPLGKR